MGLNFEECLSDTPQFRASLRREELVSATTLHNVHGRYPVENGRITEAIGEVDQIM